MFDHVAFLEISGVCNARCTFCCTGSRTHKTSGFMPVKLFSEIINKLSTEVREMQLNLYNWGEPLIHPKFKEIIYELSKYPQFTYGISTNAGTIQKFNAVMLKQLVYLRISMPGFSQESYDKISKQNFQQVTDNIRNLVSQCRQNADELNIYIDFHVYRFNEVEIAPAKKFAEELGIGFRALYAYINDWKSWCSYIKGESSNEYTSIADSFLYMDKYATEIHNRMKDIKTSACPISQLLTINHRGEVMIGCCGPYDDKRFVLGNFLDIPLTAIAENDVTTNDFCRECMKLGFPYIEKILYNEC